MKRWIFPILLTTLLLTGCSSGTYVHIERHRSSGVSSQSQTLTARSEAQLLERLQQQVAGCAQSCIVFLEGIPEENREQLPEIAKTYLLETDPIGAFALDDVSLELGTNRGRPALAVSFSYARSNADIRQILHAATAAEAASEIEAALIGCKSRIAMKIEDYQETDFVQLVSDLAQSHVDSVMEFPAVTESLYGTGDARVVELIFSYENSRETLRRMQTQVQPIFNAASLYVSGDGSDRQKLSQLYAFLMERFTYTQETSITPAYSLLLHGVGDSRAFALVYAVMCRNAGLECQTVTGTRFGEPWVWNRVLDGGTYYHVDLLRSSLHGSFREMNDSEMTGYVWDYSQQIEPEPTEEAVPESTGESESAEETVP